MTLLFKYLAPLQKHCLMTSVNQLAAQIKLIEAWKSVHQEGYAITLDPCNKERP